MYIYWSDSEMIYFVKDLDGVPYQVLANSSVAVLYLLHSITLIMLKVMFIEDIEFMIGLNPPGLAPLPTPPSLTKPPQPNPH